MTDEYLSPKQLSQLLSLNIKTVHKLLADNTIPHWRKGRIIRVHRQTLAKLFPEK